MKEKKRIYISLLFYTVAFNIMIISSVILLHELGHAVIGKLYGCSEVQIVLFNLKLSSTYSEMVCNTGPGHLMLFLSSFLFIMPLSGIFMFLKNLKEKYIGHIMIGFAVSASALDLELLINSSGIKLITVLIGLTIAVHGEYRLIHGIIQTEYMN